MANLAPVRSSGSGSASQNGTSSTPSTKDLFNAALQSRVPTNNYITHLKIWETINEGPPPPPGAPAVQRKARYIILAVQRDTGRVTLNKAKRNANGSFSIGKDWDLNTLKEIVVHDPNTFTLTLSRSYSWQTERSKEQTLFLQSTVKIFRKYTGEDGPICVNLELSDNASTDTLAPAPSSTVPRSVSPKPNVEKQRAPLINTQVPIEASRTSPSSASSRNGRSNSNSLHDGFYSARDAPVSSPLRTAPPISIPTIFTEPNDDSRDSQLTRRPTLQRYASAAPALLSPEPSADSSFVSADERQQQRQQQRHSVSQGNFPEKGVNELALPAMKPVVLARNASRLAGNASPRAASPLITEDSLTRQPASVPEVATPSPPSLPATTRPLATVLRPSKGQKGSMESLGVVSNTSSGGGGGGDARARLSSIEPVRGGAAYEKMLLAGTGLTGVAEGDDEDEGQDEDPYGGVDFDDINGVDGASDILPRSSRNRSSKRQQPHRMNSQDIRDAGEVGNVSTDLIDVDEEDTTLANVEEILEGFEWRHHHNNIAGGKFITNGGGGGMHRMTKSRKGTADVIEARLLDELGALDAANIHAIIESDDRVNLVVLHMEEALHKLDIIDSMVATYKMQLNARADDISHIESQNRGLQVYTSNQRALSAEIEKLLSTVHVDEYAVEALMENEFESDHGIGEVERAGSDLYKAMLQARRTEEEVNSGDAGALGMAAATERLEEYTALSDEFVKRLLTFLTQTFNSQTKAVLRDPVRLSALSPPRATIESHQNVEDVLGRYCGLLLYAKEVSPSIFSRISAAYFTSASERYKSEMITLFSVWKSQVARISDEEVAEANFVISGQAAGSLGISRGQTVRRGGRHGASKGARGPDEVAGYEAFDRILTIVIPLVAREQAFIADLLHINNNAVTFADYMDLEVYFRRRAAAVFNSNSSIHGQIRDMKSALDLIFGFLAPEFQSFVDQVCSKDRIQVVGVLATLDRCLQEAAELNNEFLTRILGKLHMRLASTLDKLIGEQIRAIEQTKLTVKKRKGVAHFIKVFPTFVERVEAQLTNAETLNIRTAIDNYYEQICTTMFDVLQAMAIPKVDGGGGIMSNSNVDDDKGLLNHHIILIENMHHFVKNVGRLKGSVAFGPLLRRAQSILDDALSSYIQSSLRRPLGKMMDFGDGIDALLRSTPANEVSLHSTYNRQAAKRLVKEYSSKDIRKSIEALSKRVLKHFDEEEITTLAEGGSFYDSSGISAEEIVEVLGKVWKSLEEGFTVECERLQRILRDCYSNSNDSSKLLCDFTMEDVRRPFVGNAPAGRKR
ncbi:hypothetical protein CBS101457_002651 [Exobasidium rhododendri]|nr:hypothetical protein CBS101457_002651 [Exobasidium rhododendri]